LITFERDEIEGTIGDRLRRIAAKIPDYTAVKIGDSALTFGELNRLSDELAGRILAQKGPAPEPVALLLEQSPESTLAIFGIMKAGKSAMILAPDFPVGRLREFWADAGKPLIVTEPPFYGLAADITGTSEGWLDLRGPVEKTANLESIPIQPDSTALLLYTSGTTGEPKGVMISHRLLLQTAWDNSTRYQMAERDRLTLIGSHGFGASVVHTMYTLLDGTALHFITGKIQQLNRLVEFLRREEITILVLPSFALLHQQMDAMTERVSLPDLRMVMIGGGALRRSDLQRFREYFPKTVEFSYRIASSEALTMCELRITPGSQIPWEKIPVGHVIVDKELLLLDEDRQPVAPGELGEIAIRSRYLADGYWKRPEITKAKFLPDPDGGDRRICLTGDMGRLLPDGLLEHLGRKDNIVRVRGFSIQLEAVGLALEELSGVKEAAAAAVPFPDGSSRLVAYVVPSDVKKPSLRDLRNGLAAVLPPQMIPTGFVFLDALPRTTSDRLDRQALPPPGTGRPDLDAPFAPPRNELEHSLSLIWSETIHLDRVGIDDDFFLLGGDSLLAMHMVLHVEEKLHRQIPSAFFRKPTIRHLAELCREGEAPTNAPAAGAVPAPASLEESPAARKGSGRSPSRRTPRFRKRYQARTTLIGPPSIRLLKRIPRLAAEWITLYLTYPQGCRWLSRWCSSPAVIRNFYPTEAELFRRWVDSLGGCPDAPVDALNVCVLNNILWSTRFKRTIFYLEDETFLDSMRRSSARFHRDLARIMDKAPAEPFDRFFRFEGLEHVETALRTGRGAILVTYHGAVNRFSISALARRLNTALIPTLSLTHAMKLARRDRSGPRSAINEPAIMANVAVEGLRILKHGAIVQIVPDIGYDAAEGLPLVIGGYRFLIKPGFAELALSSEAAVIPHYTTRRINGCIVMRFFPALSRPSLSSSRQDQIDNLLTQYATSVEKAWTLAPESLLWPVIDTHLNRPIAEE
jgi:amino acid adenylation domain-containing protein